MSQYLLRKAKGTYELAKFEDSDSPTAVYRFSYRGCSCPAGRRSCKHNKILKTWQSLGEPTGYVFDDTANHIGTINVS